MSHAPFLRTPCRRALLASFLILPLGCSTTTTSIVKSERPPFSRVALTRAEATPLVAELRQEGHALAGQVAFTRQCSLRTTRTFDRTEVSETKMSGAAAATYIALGVAFAAVGTGMMIAAEDQSDTVICGNGGAPRAGDTCDSARDAFLSGGAVIMASGLGFAALGGIGLARAPTRQTKPLEPERVVSVTADTSCGTREELAGTVLALQLPNGSRWTGRVDASGTARIEVSEDVSIPDAEVAVFVDAVPTALSARVERGVTVAKVSLVRTPAVRAR